MMLKLIVLVWWCMLEVILFSGILNILEVVIVWMLWLLWKVCFSVLMFVIWVRMCSLI